MGVKAITFVVVGGVDEGFMESGPKRVSQFVIDGFFAESSCSMAECQRVVRKGPLSAI
jgi:hypothetical protein